MRTLLISQADSLSLPPPPRLCRRSAVSVAAPHAQAPNPAGANAAKYDIAVVDISYIFKNHARFTRHDGQHEEGDGSDRSASSRPTARRSRQTEQQRNTFNAGSAEYKQARRRSGPHDGRVQPEDGQAPQGLPRTRGEGLLPDLSRSGRRREVTTPSGRTSAWCCDSTASRSIRTSARTCCARSTSRSSCRTRSTSRRDVLALLNRDQPCRRSRRSAARWRSRARRFRGKLVSLSALRPWRASSAIGPTGRHDSASIPATRHPLSATDTTSLGSSIVDVRCAPPTHARPARFGDRLRLLQRPRRARRILAGRRRFAGITFVRHDIGPAARDAGSTSRCASTCRAARRSS